MAPKLSVAEHEILHRLISSGVLDDKEIAKVVPCTIRSVGNARANYLRYGTTTAPPHPGGRPRVLTRPMLTTLFDHLKEEDDLTLGELACILWEKHKVRVSKPTICRGLKSVGWPLKTHREIAAQRNPDLRDAYRYNLSSSLKSWQPIYIDESGINHRGRFRQKGRAPRGVTPVRTAPLERGKRYQILTAYSQDGVVLSRVFQGGTNAAIFEDFIEQLLCHCGRWPEPDSVLIMDNAPFHNPDRIKELCARAGVRVIFLPPYSCDLNPIEEFFSELKSFVRQAWKTYERNGGTDFEAFVKTAVEIVGRRGKSARGHFRHSGWVIEEFEAGASPAAS
jgi:transposase